VQQECTNTLPGEALSDAESFETNLLLAEFKGLIPLQKREVFG
jgi:hypothetical protein